MERQDVYQINIVIDCAIGQAGELAEFYTKLLGWELTHPAANGWAAITAPNHTVYAFQEVEDYKRPTWPWQKGEQGQMLHLDFWVEDLEAAVCYAESIGAQQAGTQYFKTSRTMFDPAGHTFCLDTDGEED